MGITDKEIEQIANTNLPNNHFNPYMTAPEYFQQDIENMWIRFKLKAFFPLLGICLMSAIALVCVLFYTLF
jgi:hypothetical protein